MFKKLNLLGVGISQISWAEALEEALRCAKFYESSYFCFCNVHSLIEATESKEHFESLELADLVFPDGAPVAWLNRHEGKSNLPKISGPDFMKKTLEMAEKEQLKVFFLGGSEQTSKKLLEVLAFKHPTLQIVGTDSSKISLDNEKENDYLVNTIVASGAQILFVGLGCPKQEAWMCKNRKKLSCVQLGVGAAFDFYAGTVKRAPVWMQKMGLEWFYRLCQEPRRLFKRYLITNTKFLLKVAADKL